MNCSKLTELLQNDSGSVLVYRAFAISGLVGMLAFTVDVGMWYSGKRSTRSTADNAALSEVIELADGSDDATIETAVESSAEISIQ